MSLSSISLAPALQRLSLIPIPFSACNTSTCGAHGRTYYDDSASEADLESHRNCLPIAVILEYISRRARRNLKRSVLSLTGTSLLLNTQRHFHSPQPVLAATAKSTGVLSPHNAAFPLVSPALGYLIRFPVTCSVTRLYIDGVAFTRKHLLPGYDPSRIKISKTRLTRSVARNLSNSVRILLSRLSYSLTEYELVRLERLPISRQLGPCAVFFCVLSCISRVYVQRCYTRILYLLFLFLRRPFSSSSVN